MARERALASRRKNARDRFKNAVLSFCPKTRSRKLLDNLISSVTTRTRNARMARASQSFTCDGVIKESNLNLSEHLLNAVQRFRAIADSLNHAREHEVSSSNQRAEQMLWPVPEDHTDEALAALLEETRAGRGLRTIIENSRDSPGVTELHRQATTVFLCVLLMLQEVRHKLFDFKKSEKIRLEALEQQKLHLKELGRKSKWGRIRVTVHVPTDLQELAKQALHTSKDGSPVSPSLHGLAKSENKRSSLTNLMDAMARDAYGARGVMSGINTRTSQEQTFEEGLRPSQAIGSVPHVKPPSHWLPKVVASGEVVQDYRTTKYKTFIHYGTAEQWVAELIHMDVLQLLLMNIYMEQDHPTHVTSMGAIRIMANLLPRTTISELLAPIKSGIFHDKAQHPIQPKSKAMKVRVSIDGEVSERPTGIEVILLSMKIHRNNFALQGAAAQLFFELLAHSNDQEFSQICAATAPGDSPSFSELSGTRTSRPSSASTPRTTPIRSVRPSSATPGGNRQARGSRLSSSARVHSSPGAIGGKSKFSVSQTREKSQTSYLAKMANTTTTTNTTITTNNSAASGAFSSCAPREAEGETVKRLCFRILRRLSKTGSGDKTSLAAWSSNLSQAHRKQVISAYHSATLVLVTIASQSRDALESIYSNDTAKKLLADAVSFNRNDNELVELAEDLDVRSVSNEAPTPSAQPQFTSKAPQPAQLPSYMRSTGSMRIQRVQAHSKLQDTGRVAPDFPPPVHGQSSYPDETFFTTNRLDTAPGPSWYRETRHAKEAPRYMFDRHYRSRRAPAPAAPGKIVVKTLPVSLPSTGPISTGLFPPRDPRS